MHNISIEPLADLSLRKEEVVSREHNVPQTTQTWSHNERARTPRSPIEDDVHPRPECTSPPNQAVGPTDALRGKYAGDSMRMFQETHDVSWTQTSGHNKSAFLEHAELKPKVLTHLSPILCEKSRQYSAES